MKFVSNITKVLYPLNYLFRAMSDKCRVQKNRNKSENKAIYILNWPKIAIEGCIKQALIWN